MRAPQADSSFSSPTYGVLVTVTSCSPPKDRFLRALTYLPLETPLPAQLACGAMPLVFILSQQTILIGKAYPVDASILEAILRRGMVKKHNDVTLSMSEAKYITTGTWYTQLLWTKQMLHDHSIGQDNNDFIFDNANVTNIF